MRGHGLRLIAYILAGVLALAALTVFAYRGGPFGNGGEGPIALQQEENEEEDEEIEENDEDEGEADDELDVEDADDEADEDEVDGDEGDDADEEDELDDEESYEGGLGAQDIAQAIADEFGVTQEEVLALHAQGVGFGAIFKLYLLAQATGESVEDLLAEMEEDGGFSFGQHFHDAELEIQEDLPRNLGQLISQWRHSNGSSEVAAASEDDEEESSHGSGHGNGNAFGHGHGGGHSRGHAED